MNKIRYIDPREIPVSDLPLIVFSDCTSGLFSFLTKWRTKSPWNHVMFMLRSECFQSQGNMFSEVPLSRYMKRLSRMKFYQMIVTEEEAIYLKLLVDQDLKKSKWALRYNWLGILTQALPGKWNRRFGGQGKYCSQNVAYYLNKIGWNIPTYPNPGELNRLMETSTDKVKYLGHYSGN